MNLSNTGACAIFFHGVSENLTFKQPGDTPQTMAGRLGMDGTCSQALGSACVDYLTARAQKFAILGGDNASPQERCDELREDFEKNIDDACSQVNGGPWRNLTAVGK